MCPTHSLPFVWPISSTRNSELFARIVGMKIYSDIRKGLCRSLIVIVRSSRFSYRITNNWDTHATEINHGERLEAYSIWDFKVQRASAKKSNCVIKYCSVAPSLLILGGKIVGIKFGANCIRTISLKDSRNLKGMAIPKFPINKSNRPI